MNECFVTATANCKEIFSMSNDGLILEFGTSRDMPRLLRISLSINLLYEVVFPLILFKSNSRKSQNVQVQQNKSLTL